MNPGRTESEKGTYGQIRLGIMGRLSSSVLTTAVIPKAEEHECKA